MEILFLIAVLGVLFVAFASSLTGSVEYWQSIPRFDPVGTNIFAKLPADLVADAVKRVIYGGLVLPDKNGSERHWQGVVDYDDARVIESRIYDLPGSNILSGIISPLIWPNAAIPFTKHTYLRWRIEDISASKHDPSTKVYCEWASELPGQGGVARSNNLAAHDVPILVESLQEALRKELELTARLNPMSISPFPILNRPAPSTQTIQLAQPVPQLAPLMQAVAGKSQSLQSGQNVTPGTGNFANSASQGAFANQIGTVHVAKRCYKNIDIDQAVEAVRSEISQFGILADPIGGRSALRWEAYDTGPQLPGSIFKTVKFSEYSMDTSTSELIDEIRILWKFRAAPGTSGSAKPEIELTIDWTGVFQVSTGDLVRNLIARTEAKLRAAGAILVQTHTQASLSQIQGRTGAPAPNPRLSRRSHWVYDAYGNPVEEDDLEAQPPTRARQLASSSGVRMFWPNPQDYNENIQNPALCFDDTELKNGEPELTPLGLPKVATGAFASVYRLRCGNVDWAVRCFSAPVKDQDDRYRKTSRFICSDDLTYTVPLQYLQQGIRVHGRWFPILKMEWVEGISIYAYIDKYFQNREKMQELHQRFLKMMDELRLAGIAHSDLQHGNIIMRNDEIILVDYDGMFVPELSGYLSLERGHPNYQHPERAARHFGPYLDNFSAWLIDTCILALIHDSSLWRRFAGDAESLLFRRADLESPGQSLLFTALNRHSNIEIRERAQYLRRLLAAHIEEVPYLQNAYPALLNAQSNSSSAAPEQPQEESSETRTTSPGKSGLPDWMQ